MSPFHLVYLVWSDVTPWLALSLLNACLGALHFQLLCLMFAWSCSLLVLPHVTALRGLTRLPPFCLLLTFFQVLLA